MVVQMLAGEEIGAADRMLDEAALYLAMFSIIDP
jgi:hypothetical protein